MSCEVNNGKYVMKTENNEVVRHVTPYIQEFKTFAKGRWLGRELLEVLSAEFGGHTKEYWNQSVANGFVTVNSQEVAPNYKIKNSDGILHRSHR